MGHGHSRRSAISGPNLVARRAGSQHASNATHNSSRGIRMNVDGSTALTPYRSGDMRRVSVNAPASPHEPDQCKFQPLSNDQPQNVQRPCAKRQANTDLVSHASFFAFSSAVAAITL